MVSSFGYSEARHSLTLLTQESGSHLTFQTGDEGFPKTQDPLRVPRTQGPVHPLAEVCFYLVVPVFLLIVVLTCVYPGVGWFLPSLPHRVVLAVQTFLGPLPGGLTPYGSIRSGGTSVPVGLEP